MAQRKVNGSIFLILLVLLFGVANAETVQDSDAPEHARKAISRVQPVYPELAKQMRVSGTVRLVAVVSPNGSVKFIEPVGGHPVLLKSAEDAVMKWKFMPAPKETKELIEIHFSPE